MTECPWSPQLEAIHVPEHVTCTEAGGGHLHFYRLRSLRFLRFEHAPLYQFLGPSSSMVHVPCSPSPLTFPHKKEQKPPPIRLPTNTLFRDMRVDLARIQEGRMSLRRQMKCYSIHQYMLIDSKQKQTKLEAPGASATLLSL